MVFPPFLLFSLSRQLDRIVELAQLNRCLDEKRL